MYHVHGQVQPDDAGKPGASKGARRVWRGPVGKRSSNVTFAGWLPYSVLADAIRRYGAPEALVTDGGGQFYSTVAVQLYDMLGIRKERIDPGEPWENYAETLLYVMWNLENSHITCNISMFFS